ncbi:DUF2147 domain-containing protein [Belliella sp. DSM 107340]|uniref:DUF2147 domain-containing protein n=1 Tax=Belliella calami TaxID=2923436 RepID=A0ABS9UJG0_9BACT|nr:DUF2147 domain-containing protein [Belliella calami]MCH7396754.1 DUF2147 domain-containing protein [Belliella calami]
MLKSHAILLMLYFFPVHGIQAQGQSPSNDVVGEWKNEKGDAKFKIYRKGDMFYGDIIWGTGGPTKDVNNPDPAKKNRDLVGLTILNDFKFENKNLWSSGTIYEPKDGKTYSCKMTLKKPNQLEVRGFVGVSLFGRSETWTRID